MPAIALAIALTDSVIFSIHEVSRSFRFDADLITPTPGARRIALHQTGSDVTSVDASLLIASVLTFLISSLSCAILSFSPRLLAGVRPKLARPIRFPLLIFGGNVRSPVLLWILAIRSNLSLREEKLRNENLFSTS